MRARVDLQTHAFEAAAAAAVKAVAPAELERATEEWFGFEYARAALPAALLEGWAAPAAPAPELALPTRNEYLPTDFSLGGEEGGAGGDAAADGGAEEAADAFPPPPTLLVDAPGLRVWHKRDARFRLPRTNAYFRLAGGAAADGSPRAAALAHLVAKLAEDALCEEVRLFLL